jgi:hypothetical protein
MIKVGNNERLRALHFHLTMPRLNSVPVPYISTVNSNKNLCNGYKMKLTYHLPRGNAQILKLPPCLAYKLSEVHRDGIMRLGLTGLKF